MTTTLPKYIKLITMPDNTLPLTIGNYYRVIDEVGSKVVIMSDMDGEAVSVHWSCFVITGDD